jgi:hypothetical protein
VCVPNICWGRAGTGLRWSEMLRWQPVRVPPPPPVVVPPRHRRRSAVGPRRLTPPRHLHRGRPAVRDQPRLGEVLVLARGSRPRPSLFVVRR